MIYGRGLSLSVQADPTQPLFSLLQYRWYRNGNPLGGKTSPNIIISSTTEGDAGEYYCVVSNGSAQSVSKVARVEVINPHVMQQPPQPASSAFVTPSSGVGGGVYRIQQGREGHYNTRGTTSRQSQIDPSRHDNHPPAPHKDFLSREASAVNRATGMELERELMVGGEEDRPAGQPVGWDLHMQSANTEAKEMSKFKSETGLIIMHIAGSMRVQLD